MGGLQPVMRFTTATWVVAALAIRASRRSPGSSPRTRSIAAASLAGRPGLWAAAWLASLLTAVYIWRATHDVLRAGAVRGRAHERRR